MKKISFIFISKLFGPLLNLFLPILLVKTTDLNFAAKYTLIMSYSLILIPVVRYGLQIAVFKNKNLELKNIIKIFYLRILLLYLIASLLCAWDGDFEKVAGLTLTVIGAIVYIFSISSLWKRKIIKYAFLDQGVVNVIYAFLIYFIYKNINFQYFEIKIFSIISAIFFSFGIIYLLKNKNYNYHLKMTDELWLLLTNILSAISMSGPFIFLADKLSALEINDLRFYERAIAIIMALPSIIAPIYYVEIMKDDLIKDRYLTYKFIIFSITFTIIACLIYINFLYFMFNREFINLKDLLFWLASIFFPVGALLGFRLNVNGSAKKITITTLLSFILAIITGLIFSYPEYNIYRYYSSLIFYQGFFSMIFYLLYKCEK